MKRATKKLIKKWNYKHDNNTIEVGSYGMIEDDFDFDSETGKITITSRGEIAIKLTENEFIEEFIGFENLFVEKPKAQAVSMPADSRQIATEAAESNAPPCAPPDYAYIHSALEAILPCIFIELTDTDTTPSQIFRHLANPETQSYITEKIAHKACNYPHLLPLCWANAAEFKKFGKALKGEIYRLLLTILKNRNAKKAAPTLTAARESLSRHEVSIDAPLPSSNDGNDGKSISYHDIIPDPTGDPLSILIAAEEAAEEAAVISTLSDNEKARLIAEFDLKNKIKKGELFYIDNSSAAEADETNKNETTNLEKYRRRKNQTPPEQLELFTTAGGAL